MATNPDVMMGMPSQLSQPSLALVFGDGQLLPLEYACHRCKGSAPTPDKVIHGGPGTCPDCKGRGHILSNQGRVLLAFLKKWGSQE
jgi:hypothetical protein